jgi:peptidyl-prolyl cis-trans isomerase D
MPSMFDFVREQKWLVRIFLILICIPFALFGVEMYQRDAVGVDAIATVDGEKIPVNDFNQKYQAQQDQFRQMLGRNFDPSIFDSPQARQGIVDQLVTERILGRYVTTHKMTPGDAELAQAIAENPDFQENGQFSKDRYQQLLRATGRSPIQYQEETRRTLAFQRLGGGLFEAGIGSKKLAAREAALAGETREVSEMLVSPDQFNAQVKVGPDAVEAYYKANPKEFEIPEAVRAEFVVLNIETFSAQIQVSAGDVRKIYDERFAGKAKARDDAKKKAEDLLTQVRKSPDQFAALAKVHSDDPGSKDIGGDLGFNARGAMVQAFDNMVFRLRPKEISPLVETEFGFHIIMLEEIRKAEGGGKSEERRARHILLQAPTDVKTFEAMRVELERDLRKEKASGEFPKLAEKFTARADQQVDNLKPIADEFKLALSTSDWIPRSGGPAAGALGNSRMLAALFDVETLKSKRSTEALELNPGIFIVARPVEHRAPSVRPLDAARADIIKRLTAQEAKSLAMKAGQERLTALQKGTDAGGRWTNTRVLTREAPTGLSRDAARAIFRAETAKLPVYIGLEAADGGYAIYRISKASQGEAADEKRLSAAQTNLARTNAQEQFLGFVSGLREKSKVEINKANLERKSN